MKRKIYQVKSKALSPAAGTYSALISTESVDRDGDILEAAGVRLDRYMKNPVVLWGHDYQNAEAVIGKALSVVPKPGLGVLAKWKFAGLDISPHADLVKRLWASGFLNATSVGYIPHKTEPLNGPNSGKRVTDWELLEFSIVPIPSNQDALRLAAKMLKKGHPTEPDIVTEISSRVDELSAAIHEWVYTKKIGPDWF